MLERICGPGVTVMELAVLNVIHAFSEIPSVTMAKIDSRCETQPCDCVTAATPLKKLLKRYINVNVRRLKMPSLLHVSFFVYLYSTLKWQSLCNLFHFCYFT